MTSQSDLPLLPSGGNRQELDALWLERLRAHGWRPYLAEPPPPPDLLVKAIGEFNDGRFWHCHETLEEVWRPAPYPLRLFYQGIIKVAVGFHHLGNHNRRGATSLFEGGVAALTPFLPEFMGVPTKLLLQEAEAWLARLAGPGALRWDEVDRLPWPRIELPGA